MILRFKFPQKFFEGANMCPGWQKKPYPAHGKTHPLVRKYTFAWENSSTLPHIEDWCPKRGDKCPPSCSKAQVQRREWASLHGRNTHPCEETHFHLMLLDM